MRHYASAAALTAHAVVAPIPASSGNTHRHRLARGGNRQLSRALFTIAMVQARWHPPARETRPGTRGRQDRSLMWGTFQLASAARGQPCIEFRC